MNVFIARQPIFETKQRVYGYELLYRSSLENVYSEADGDKASFSVIGNTILVIGSQQISQGKRVFVNFTRKLLLEGAATYLPKGIGVVEILEDVEPDDELIEAIKTIRSQGYTLALDDFVLRGNEYSPFLELVDIIKVDLRQTDEQEREAIAQRFPGSGRVKLLAEKTETREEFANALKMGYSYFQGYFFCKPVMFARRDISGHKIHYFRILKELSADNPSFDAIKNIIEHNPSLAYKLLKYINSAFFGLRREVSSIIHALQLLGEEEIRRWLSLVVLMELGKEQPLELMRLCSLRARFSENLASEAGYDQRKSEFFFMGLFSCIDVMLGRPMEEILEDLPIRTSIKEALLGKSNLFRLVLDLVISYEKANWMDFPILASRLGVEESDVQQSYSNSIAWADQVI
ncbi:MAG: EAL and HDOD domain-containing protein [Syntrophobacteraceae bacterium]